MRFHELDTLPVADWRDNRYAHPRATPEKPFCDWLYLGHSPRSPLHVPPLDLEFDKLNKSRLRRIVKAMDIKQVFDAWLTRKLQYGNVPEVQENATVRSVDYSR